MTVMPNAKTGQTATMSMVQALNSALDVMLERDLKVLVFGEDVGFFGGVFRVTVDGETIHDRKRDGGFMELPDLKQRIRDRIAPERDLGHSDRKS